MSPAHCSGSIYRCAARISSNAGSGAHFPTNSRSSRASAALRWPFDGGLCPGLCSISANLSLLGLEVDLQHAMVDGRQVSMSRMMGIRSDLDCRRARCGQAMVVQSRLHDRPGSGHVEVVTIATELLMNVFVNVRTFRNTASLIQARADCEALTGLPRFRVARIGLQVTARHFGHLPFRDRVLPTEPAWWTRSALITCNPVASPDLKDCL